MTKHNAMHKTASGSVTLVETWGHGDGVNRNYHMLPFHITSDDGDGHYSAWRVTGKMLDAAKAIGRLELGAHENNGRVAVVQNCHVSVERAPEGFWIDVLDDEGELVETKTADPALYPYVVAS